MERPGDAAATHRVELALSELKSLSVLPGVAVQYLPRVLQTTFSPAALTDIAEADPAIACAILSLASQADTGSRSRSCSIRAALDRLSAQMVRDAMLTLKVLTTFEPEAPAPPMTLSRKDVLIHCLAAAYCAREISQILPQPIDAETAYTAGLLHDIGKLALQEIMPRGFAQITDKARLTAQDSSWGELERLGIDHTVIGKELARRWQLPQVISSAIWLHHSDAALIAELMPQMKLAHVVQAADSIVRSLGLGGSGSFDAPESMAAIAESLAVDPATLEGISGRLPEAVRKKAEALHLDMPNPSAKYCDLIQSAAAQLAARQTQLSAENRTLQLGLNHLEWISDFLLNINSSATAIEVAADLATRWQKVFQTGTVCLYLVGDDNAQIVEAAVVEALGHTTKTALERPADSVLVPASIADRFMVTDAGEELAWLFEQLEVDFNLNQTKLVPLLCDGRTVAVIIFELNYPGDQELFSQKFAAAAAIAAVALRLVSSRQWHEALAERFVRLIRRPKDTYGPPQDAWLETVAEMAAGIAHELNNPLSVISGRAQLLAEVEGDQDKRESLLQIQQNAGDASSIIDELMSFAQPGKPRPSLTGVRQMIDEAVEIAGRRLAAGYPNMQLSIEQDVRGVFVDSAQVVSSLANIISNSIESYTDSPGPITISARLTPDGRSVQLLISDLGCGMDAESLRKAAYPFFSAKPAGRKRGMGLAYASRLIHLNNGSLRVAGTPGKGTTVKVVLPTNPPRPEPSRRPAEPPFGRNVHPTQ